MHAENWNISGNLISFSFPSSILHPAAGKGWLLLVFPPWTYNHICRWRAETTKLPETHENSTSFLRVPEHLRNPLSSGRSVCSSLQRHSAKNPAQALASSAVCLYTLAQFALIPASCSFAPQLKWEAPEIRSSSMMAQIIIFSGKKKYILRD